MNKASPTTLGIFNGLPVNINIVNYLRELYTKNIIWDEYLEKLDFYINNIDLSSSKIKFVQKDDIKINENNFRKSADNILENLGNTNLFRLFKFNFGISYEIVKPNDFSKICTEEITEEDFNFFDNNYQKKNKITKKI